MQFILKLKRARYEAIGKFFVIKTNPPNHLKKLCDFQQFSEKINKMN